MQTIMQNESSKTAALSNIQNSNNKLNSSIKFYARSLKRKFKEFDEIDKGITLTNKRLDKVEKLNIRHVEILCGISKNKINEGVFLRKGKILKELVRLRERSMESDLRLNNNSNKLIENVKMFALESSKETEFYVIGNELYTPLYQK